MKSGYGCAQMAYGVTVAVWLGETEMTVTDHVVVLLG